ncbi:hypothetical protein BHE74_00035162 [Ensete ventricosum]|nr:hypothetical protein BHE74_00035162 [Ensete ventricosum]
MACGRPAGGEGALAARRRGRWPVYVPFSVKLQDFQLFNDHIVVYERENGLPTITVYNLPPIGEPIGRLQSGRTVEFIDPVYSVDPEESQFSSSIVRYSYSSLRTPRSVYDHDMKTGMSVLKKIETVEYKLSWI